MSLRILWAPRAAKERDGLDGIARARVVAAIERLAETGVGDVKALKGSLGLPLLLRWSTRDPLRSRDPHVFCGADFET